MSNEQAVVKKGPKRAAIAPDARLLVGRQDAAAMLSISPRAVDYLVANKKLQKPADWRARADSCLRTATVLSR